MNEQDADTLLGAMFEAGREELPAEGRVEVVGQRVQALVAAGACTGLAAKAAGALPAATALSKSGAIMGGTQAGSVAAAATAGQAATGAAATSGAAAALAPVTGASSVASAGVASVSGALSSSAVLGTGAVSLGTKLTVVAALVAGGATASYQALTPRPNPHNVRSEHSESLAFPDRTAGSSGSRGLASGALAPPTPSSKPGPSTPTHGGFGEAESPERIEANRETGRGDAPETRVPARVRRPAIAPATVSNATVENPELAAMLAVRAQIRTSPHAAVETLEALRPVSPSLEELWQALHVEALVRCGNAAAAAVVLQRFEARYPDSPYLHRLRADSPRATSAVPR